MKTAIRVAVVTMALAGIVACSKKDAAQPEAAKSAPAIPSMTAEDIADALSRAVCGRMVACNQNAGINEVDCAAGMTKDLAQALPEKAKTVDKPALNSCVAAIGGATCDALNSPTPPKGCEFMD